MIEAEQLHARILAEVKKYRRYDKKEIKEGRY